MKRSSAGRRTCRLPLPLPPPPGLPGWTVSWPLRTVQRQAASRPQFGRPVPPNGLTFPCANPPAAMFHSRSHPLMPSMRDIQGPLIPPFRRRSPLLKILQNPSKKPPRQPWSTQKTWRAPPSLPARQPRSPRKKSQRRWSWAAKSDIKPPGRAGDIDVPYQWDVGRTVPINFTDDRTCHYP